MTPIDEIMRSSGLDILCTGACTVLIQILGMMAYDVYPIAAATGAVCGAILGVAGVLRLWRERGKG
jgi:hypothetical protein